ncbi:hypothetical protein LX15_006419 [Streptoalloteichus tenebrarius]|uniref:Transposase n=1 Tax=Streptoalloteichus tenebrarius (strain ATCC 17920 / DSM 40477 / JCM 4838 / CBS 697.72 / NBRC 16177 / NCIMB 11028 / NRRL B-12390 / A12253. 1 / ISP 5477) TaxID=1933 RepID=A0ABT1I4E2_STRSD|nr:hypothetical protein [Streptoalloteichus tenebrarius]MCP2262677.1 hypothetical protein [Streptoalloteichus tenebrarius]BFF03001.1 hypothetical protein GCM10020241_46760 [Streptoalloteichus tenebrarius]
MREPNEEFARARESITSPTTGHALSRQELADQVNRWIYEHRNRVVDLDETYIGKLERGAIRWPQEDYRAAVRAILKVRTDRELGFHLPAERGRHLAWRM